MTSKKEIRKQLKGSLESIYIKSRIKLDDQLVYDKEAKAFVEEHLDEYVEQCWSFVMRRI